MPILDAQGDFRRARCAHLMAALARRLRGRPQDDPPLTLASRALPSGGPARLEVVPLAEIVGTVDPTIQFDRQFRPASDLMRHRWERIALAYRQGVALPPVALRRGPDGYYVADGRHRVSVAKAMRLGDIEAWVTGPAGGRTRCRASRARRVGRLQPIRLRGA